MMQHEPYVLWTQEEEEGEEQPAPDEPGQFTARLVRAVSGPFGTRQETLAWLGRRPELTPTLQEELEALYPNITFNWPAIAQALATPPDRTDVRALSDDQVALQLQALAQERGLTVMDLSLKLGYHERQPLPEVLRLLEQAATIARFERTSGSVYQYLAERHTEYAYLLYKARLFFEGDEQTLQETIAAEPQGYSDAAWSARRRFWKAQLAAYQRSREARAARLSKQIEEDE